MKKLVRGIVEFRNKIQPGDRDTFAKLALGQSPDTLFVACSDSRVAPNVFASTEPGDMFVVRNVGNLIPECGEAGVSESDESEAAAIEFALLSLRVRNIIVCGHSECGAMHAICQGRYTVKAPHLRSWLRHGEPALARAEKYTGPAAQLKKHNLISQQNVLLQLEHLMTYPLIQQRVADGNLQLHGWWFDIAHADVYSYDKSRGEFILIDETEANRLISVIQV